MRHMNNTHGLPMPNERLSVDHLADDSLVNLTPNPPDSLIVIASCFFNDEIATAICLSESAPFYHVVMVDLVDGNVTLTANAENICALMPEYSELCGYDL